MFVRAFLVSAKQKRQLKTVKGTVKFSVSENFLPSTDLRRRGNYSAKGLIMENNNNNFVQSFGIVQRATET